MMANSQDEVRKLILAESEKAGGKGKLAEWSRAMGRNDAYLHQFITRGTPRKLGENDRAVLAALINVPEDNLRAPDPGRPLAPALPLKIESVSRALITFYVREWRKFCEVSPSVVAIALRMDSDDYAYREARPYKFTVEQLMTIAETLKIQFDSMRWNPEKLPAPQPAKGDISRINKALGRK